MVLTWDLVVIIFFTKFFIAVFYILENSENLVNSEYLWELLGDSEKEVVSKLTKSPSDIPCILSRHDPLVDRKVHFCIRW